ncbi:MAG TPA: cobalamin biosynthesis protein, partial [Pirellulales bacterium]
MTLAETVGPSLALAAPVLIALALDLTLGDPPNRWHPTAWMGSFIAWGRRLAPKEGRLKPFCAGLLILLVGATLSASAGA